MDKIKSFINQYNIKLHQIVLGVILIIFTFFIGYRIYVSEKTFFPISVVAVIVGLIFEGKRLSEEFNTFLIKLFSSFLVSFSVLIPFEKNGGYNLELHLGFLPYAFVGFFVIMTVYYHEDKIIPKLSEGITLIQSISIFYWILNFNFNDSNLFFSLFVIVLFPFLILFSLFTMFNAFSHFKLSKTNRFMMSIWSTIIMLVFGLDNLFKSFQMIDSLNNKNLINTINIFIKFFLLGVSSIYLFINIVMLIGFIPHKGYFFNKKYFDRVKELKEQHIERYSENQVAISHSLFCIVFSGTWFYLNFHYQIFPRHTAIWLLFVVFPLVLWAWNLLLKKT